MALNTPPYSGNVTYQRAPGLTPTPEPTVSAASDKGERDGALAMRRPWIVGPAIIIPLLVSLYGFVTMQPVIQPLPAAPTEAPVRGRLLAADDTILAEGASLNRNYPQGELAGAVVGFTGAVQPDGRYGLEGLEYSFDAALQAGLDVTLTLDPVLQSAAERQLSASALTHGAESGAAVVLEVGTGRVLAAASYPPFNPNAFQDASRAQMTNRPFQQVYEPGSVIKPLVVAGLLQDGLLSLSETVDSPMTLRVGLKTFRDVAWHDPVLSIPDVLAYSSNSGMIHLSQRFEPARLHTWLSSFGIGRDLDMSSTYTRTGLLNSWDRWVPQDQAANALGQNLSLTPLQLAAAYSIFANDGVYVPPYLVDGEEVPAPHRVLSPEVAYAMRDTLTYVMENSGLRNSIVPGVRVAGKTGTADVFDAVSGTYPEDDYAISFTGMFPSEAPKVVVAVMLMKPDPDSTSTYVAAPLFRAIGSEVMAHFGGAAGRPEVATATRP